MRIIKIKKKIKNKKNGMKNKLVKRNEPEG